MGINSSEHFFSHQQPTTTGEAVKADNLDAQGHGTACRSLQVAHETNQAIGANEEPQNIDAEPETCDEMGSRPDECPNQGKHFGSVFAARFMIMIGLIRLVFIGGSHLEI
jgi:hypothetical protein